MLSRKIGFPQDEREELHVPARAQGVLAAHQTEHMQATLLDFHINGAPCGKTNVGVECGFGTEVRAQFSYSDAARAVCGRWNGVWHFWMVAGEFATCSVNEFRTSIGQYMCYKIYPVFPQDVLCSANTAATICCSHAHLISIATLCPSARRHTRSAPVQCNVLNFRYPRESSGSGHCLVCYADINLEAHQNQ